MEDVIATHEIYVMITEPENQNFLSIIALDF